MCITLFIFRQQMTKMGETCIANSFYIYMRPLFPNIPFPLTLFCKKPNSNK